MISTKKEADEKERRWVQELQGLQASKAEVDKHLAEKEEEPTLTPRQFGQRSRGQHVYFIGESFYHTWLGLVAILV
eukprot:g10022.t1